MAESPALCEEIYSRNATICYVANALLSSSFTFLNALLYIVNVPLAFMKVFTCIHKSGCWYLYRTFRTAEVIAFSQVMMAALKGTVHQIALWQSVKKSVSNSWSFTLHRGQTSPSPTLHGTRDIRCGALSRISIL